MGIRLGRSEVVQPVEQVVPGGLEGVGIGIGDFTDVFDAVPPGVDELVALAKVVSLARRDELPLLFRRLAAEALDQTAARLARPRRL
mgnify:CR=1 FL=1